MLLPGGILGMTVWLIYLLLKEPTNVIVATFIAAIIGSCVSQILSILYKTPAVVFILPFWHRWFQVISPTEQLPFL